VLNQERGWWLGRFVSTELYGVKSGDVPTFVAAVVFLGGVTFLAGLIPSTRAARLDPTTALRNE
jgi:ABC-type antimicrobial peptide transport system permease subunit